MHAFRKSLGCFALFAVAGCATTELSDDVYARMEARVNGGKVSAVELITEFRQVLKTLDHVSWVDGKLHEGGSVCSKSKRCSQLMSTIAVRRCNEITAAVKAGSPPSEIDYVNLFESDSNGYWQSAGGRACADARAQAQDWKLASLAKQKADAEAAKKAETDRLVQETKLAAEKKKQGTLKAAKALKRQGVTHVFRSANGCTLQVEKNVVERWCFAMTACISTIDGFIDDVTRGLCKEVSRGVVMCDGPSCVRSELTRNVIVESVDTTNWPADVPFVAGIKIDRPVVFQDALGREFKGWRWKSAVKSPAALAH